MKSFAKRNIKLIVAALSVIALVGYFITVKMAMNGFIQYTEEQLQNYPEPLRRGIDFDIMQTIYGKIWLGATIALPLELLAIVVAYLIAKRPSAQKLVPLTPNPETA